MHPNANRGAHAMWPFVGCDGSLGGCGGEGGFHRGCETCCDGVACYLYRASAHLSQHPRKEPLILIEEPREMLLGGGGGGRVGDGDSADIGLPEPTEVHETQQREVRPR